MTLGVFFLGWFIVSLPVGLLAIAMVRAGALADEVSEQFEGDLSDCYHLTVLHDAQLLDALRREEGTHCEAGPVVHAHSNTAEA